MKFLLLQCRHHQDAMQQQEMDCFAETLNITHDDLVAKNIPYDELDFSLVDEVDAVLVGGSGDFSVLDKYPWLHSYFDFLQHVCEKECPMFASCFGFQALTVALGGKVIHDPGRAEVGTYEVYLNEAGQQDLLFQESVSSAFLAQMGHKDRAVELPPQVVNLAFSERCPYQAFKIKGAPIYATQFHPELSMQRNRERFLAYMENYDEGKIDVEIRKNLEDLRDTSESQRLLKKFVELLQQQHCSLYN